MNENSRLAEVLEDLRLPQKRLAELCGYKSQASVTKLIEGANKIPDYVIHCLTHNFNVSGDWLKNGTGTMYVNGEKPTYEKIMAAKPVGKSNTASTGDNWAEIAYKEVKGQLEVTNKYVQVLEFLLQEKGVPVGKVLGRKSRAVLHLLNNNIATDLATPLRA